MLGFEQYPVEARSGDHLGGDVAAQTRPQPDLRFARLERVLEVVDRHFHCLPLRKASPRRTRRKGATKSNREIAEGPRPHSAISRFSFASFASFAVQDLLATVNESPDPASARRRAGNRNRSLCPPALCACRRARRSRACNAAPAVATDACGASAR